MKKILYIVPDFVNIESKSTITTKILSQMKVLNESFDSYLIGYGLNNIEFSGRHEKNILSKINKKNRRRKLFKAVLDVSRKINFDYYYIRYTYSDLRFIKLLNQLGKEAKIYVEIATFPYDLELLGYKKINYKGIVILTIDRLFRLFLKKSVSKIVTYSSDKNIYGIETICISNGVETIGISPKKCSSKISNTLNFITVSSMKNYHAYERLIYGIKEYYDQKGTKILIVYMIGDGPEYNKYRDLVKLLGLENNFIFTGFLSGVSLEKYYNKSDIAFESLGCHRKNIDVTSSLKTREYLAKGLPIISSVKIDYDNGDIDSIFYVPSNETSINIKEIIAFFDRFSEFSCEENVAKIRKIAIEKVDIKFTFKKVIDSMKGISDEK